MSDELIIKEYSEVSSQCRWYEKMIRMNLNIFIPIQSIIIAFIWQYAKTDLNKYAAVSIAMVVSIGAILSDIRLREYYTSFRERGIEIERKLDFQVSMFTSVSQSIKTKRSLGHRVIYRGVFIGLFLVSLAGIFKDIA